VALAWALPDAEALPGVVVQPHGVVGLQHDFVELPHGAAAQLHAAVEPPHGAVERLRWYGV
jgi:hypothetical protein